MKIGDRIRIARKINKITAVDLAKHIEISAPTLKKIEQNKGFVSLELIKKIVSYPQINISENELSKYYYEQNLEKKVIVRARDRRVYIIIPSDIAIGFELENKNSIFCCYLSYKLILAHQENDEYVFEKRSIFKDRYSYYFFLGQKLKNFLGKTVTLNLDLKKKVLKIYLV